MSYSTTHRAALERRAYRVSEFAEMLALSRPYIYKLAAQQKIKISRIGGRAVIFADEADRFISKAKSAS